ncbi:MAG: hypothetical protein AAB916_02420 [Patescibacteria group bacterium]
MATFRTSQLFSRDLYNGVNVSVSLPEWVFRPDQWSAAFLRGLRRCTRDWRSLCVWEVGVGSGLNLIILGKLLGDVTWYYSDYDSRCVPLATSNLEAAKMGHLDFCPLEGAWDLVTPPAGMHAPAVDVIFGCLPQVPLAHADLSVGDKIAHYYDPERYPKAHLNVLGLGLNETLLVQARDVLLPCGTVVLNLSGRPGLKRLKTMFQFCGYEAEVIYEEMIPQHWQTSVASLASLEEAGQHDFEFFADARGKEKINAREAEVRRMCSKSVFHKIYVIAGRTA